MAKLDVDKLRYGLIVYLGSLRKHTAFVEQDAYEVQRWWQALNAEYGGQRAEELERDWMQTTAWFNDYINQTHRLAKFLEERIESLRDV